MALLNSIRQQFVQTLITLYPEQEIQSIANMAFEHVMGMSRMELRQQQNFNISVVQKQALEEILKRLSAAEPIQYVLGEGYFYGLQFKVNPSVLIPRPETEELVQWILNDYKQAKNIKLLDICTGSGCIAITVKKHHTDWDISAVDISKESLNTAITNAQLHETPVNFIQADILQSSVLSLQGSYFNIIVSNPPYVMPAESDQMHRNVLEYEPHLAVFVDDEDALLFYRAIADLAVKTLAPGGRLYFEINEAKGPEVVEMLAGKGFKNIVLRKDLNNTDRMVRADLIN